MGAIGHSLRGCLSEERAECFLAAMSQESWYLAWREWVMKNQEQQAPIPANRLPIVRSIVNSMICLGRKRSVQS